MQRVRPRARGRHGRNGPVCPHARQHRGADAGEVDGLQQVRHEGEDLERARALRCVTEHPGALAPRLSASSVLLTRIGPLKPIVRLPCGGEPEPASAASESLSGPRAFAFRRRISPIICWASRRPDRLSTVWQSAYGAAPAGLICCPDAAITQYDPGTARHPRTDCYRAVHGLP